MPTGNKHKAYLAKCINIEELGNDTHLLTLDKYYILFKKNTTLNNLSTVNVIDNEGGWSWFYSIRFKIVNPL